MCLSCISCDSCKHCGTFPNGDYFCLLNQRYVLSTDSCDFFDYVNSDDSNSSDFVDIDLF